MKLLRRIERAIARKQRIHLKGYVAWGGVVSTRTVLPYRLVKDGGGHIYLHAACDLRHGRRTFRLDRIDAIVVRVGRVADQEYRDRCPELLEDNVAGGEILAAVQL